MRGDFEGDLGVTVLGSLPVRTSEALADAGVQVGPGARVAWVPSGDVPRLLDALDTPGFAVRPAVIVLQPPVDREEYVGVLKAARAWGAQVRIADPDRRRAAVEDLVAAARRLGELASVTMVRVRCEEEGVYTALHILTDAFGRPHPVLDEVEDGVLAGTAGSARLLLCVGSGPLRVEVSSTAGELLLVSRDGPLLWQAQGLPQTLTPADECAAARVADQRRALLHEVASPVSPTASRARSQKEIFLSGLLAGTPYAHRAGHDLEGASLPPAVRLCGADLLARASGTFVLAPFSGLARAAADAAGRALVPVRQGQVEAATEVADSYSRAAMTRLLRPALPAGSVAELLARLRVHERHAWLVRRWLAALTAKDVLVEDGQTLLLRADPQDPGDHALADAYDSLGFSPLMARLHSEIVSRLGALVRDESRVEEILFAEHDTVTALASYQDNVVTRYLNAALADVVSRVPPAGPVLRVVELGAGPGICSKAVLDAVEGRAVDYLLTDISPVFTTAARDRLARPGLRFGLLDIDSDLVNQEAGPEQGQVDVVVASNVLHNAAHTGRTLRHIRRLLRPGGVLAVVEATRDSHAVLTSMAFLLSPPDGPRHVDEVFLDRQAWRRELSGAGFAIAFDLPDPDDQLAVSGQHLVVGVAR